MLLTISTTHRPATDLGYLLHKHPDRVQSFSQSFGQARVFYPEATEDRCRVALMLDVDSRAAAVAWWEEMTGEGGEGMVVKPASFVAQGRRGTAQPVIKVRGPEYLRIIYGPEYLEPSQLDRLRDRNLGRKRSLAVREFGLGVEALERLARAEPLYRIHECVFGVLALESEPVDPRL